MASCCRTACPRSALRARCERRPVPPKSRLKRGARDADISRRAAAIGGCSGDRLEPLSESTRRSDPKRPACAMSARVTTREMFTCSGRCAALVRTRVPPSWRHESRWARRRCRLVAAEPRSRELDGLLDARRGAPCSIMSSPVQSARSMTSVSSSQASTRWGRSPSRARRSSARSDWTGLHRSGHRRGSAPGSSSCQIGRAARRGLGSRARTSSTAPSPISAPARLAASMRSPAQAMPITRGDHGFT